MFNSSCQVVVDGPGEQATNGPAPVDNTRTTTSREVDRKAIVITRPEPAYTEEARKNQITGTVVLRAVLSSSGALTNIHIVSGLRFGLTEEAISAAKQLKFIPAIKNGHFVSQWAELQYIFNLY